MSPYRAFLESLEKHRKGLVRLLLLLLVNAAVFGAVTYRLANKQNRLSEDLQRFSFVLAQKKGELERLSVAEVRATSNAAAVAEFWDDVVKPRVPDRGLGRDRPAGGSNERAAGTYELRARFPGRRTRANQGDNAG